MPEFCHPSLAGRSAIVIAVRADMRDAQACERVVARALEDFGSLQALVNNAAIGLRHISETFNTRPVRFWEAPLDRWRDIVEANVLGPFYMARAAAPELPAIV